MMSEAPMVNYVPKAKKQPKRKGVLKREQPSILDAKRLKRIKRA